MKSRCAPVSPSIGSGSAGADSQAPGAVGDRQAAEVADVLADGQLAVDVVVRSLLGVSTLY